MNESKKKKIMQCDVFSYAHVYSFLENKFCNLYQHVEHVLSQILLWCVKTGEKIIFMIFFFKLCGIFSQNTLRYFLLKKKGGGVVDELTHLNVSNCRECI